MKRKTLILFTLFLLLILLVNGTFGLIESVQEDKKWEIQKQHIQYVIDSTPCYYDGAIMMIGEKSTKESINRGGDES